MVKQKKSNPAAVRRPRIPADKIYNGPDANGKQKAKEELNMTEETTRQNIKELKLFLKQRNRLPDHIAGVNEDEWFENYLILNKNDLDRTKENLEIYFKLKEILPEAYLERDAHSTLMDKSFHNTMIAWCPKPDRSGNRIAIYGHISDKASDFDVITLGNRMVAMVDMFLKEGVDWCSLIILCDLSKTKLGHLTKYPIFLMKKFFDYAWKAYPERIAQIHIIHPPIYLEYVLALFRPFLREKIKNRIIVHSKIDTLYDHIDRSLLPTDYGGELPYTAIEINDAFQEKLKKYEDYLQLSAREHRPLPEDKTEEIDINQNDFKKLTVD
uniref:Alpha-tocopherol transfer protein-like n=1 Tax=Cacopsylla melanoneura TaxID=428564 RepID=A0A8D8TH43_9HEMI